jgi:hypothetical protein
LGRSPPFIELGFGTVALRVWLVQAIPAEGAMARLSPPRGGDVADEAKAMSNTLRAAVTRLREALVQDDRTLFRSVDRAGSGAPPAMADAVASSAASAAGAGSCTRADALAAVDAGQQAWDDVAAALQRLAHVYIDGGTGGTLPSAAALVNELARAYARTLRRPARCAAAVSRDPSDCALVAGALRTARDRAERALENTFSASVRASKRRRVSASGSAGASAADANTPPQPPTAEALERLHEELAAITAAQLWLATAAPR